MKRRSRSCSPRAHDEHIGLRFEDESWTWAAVVRECATRAAWLETLRSDGPVPRRRAARQRARVRVPSRWCRARGCHHRRHQPDPPGRGTGCRHPSHRLLRHRHRSASSGAARRSRHGCPERSACSTSTAPGGRARSSPTAHAELPPVLPTADALYVLIFTSGSTGAPKAVRGTQGRFARFGAAMPFTSDDTLYCSMPLFHGNALASNFVPALATGATIALRRTFSASAFFDDLRRFDATYFNTVGRALSYVLATPESSLDRDHRVKFALGPESSPADVKAFRARFGIPVVQGYGQSEGVIVLSPTRGAPAGRARSARAGPGRRGRASRHGCRVRTRRGSTTTGGSSMRSPRSARSCAGMPPGASRGTTTTKRRPSPVPATVGTGRATSHIATTTECSTSRAAAPTGCESTPRTSRPRPSNASSDARPAWRPSRCTPFPIRSPATR